MPPMDKFCCRKIRHGIKFKIAHREKKYSVAHADTWTSTVLAEFVHDYSSCDICNVDETGIYFHAVPGVTVFSTDQFHRHK